MGQKGGEPIKMGFSVYCDRCKTDMDPKGHRAALLMGEEHLLDLCPSCAYLVADEIKMKQQGAGKAKK
jgi:hypothetical protein